MPHKPRRIISLAPSATETLYAIGAGDRIVADTSVDDYPLAAVALPKVGGYSDPSVEKILFYKPDLVVAFRGNPSSLIDMLDKLSIPVFAIDPVTVAGISDSIRDVGRLVGSSERAEKVSGDLERRVRTVEEKVARLHRPAPPGLLEVWYDNGVTAAGPRTFMGDVFRVAGAKNVVSGGSSDYPRLSAEAVISLNPQCLFLTEEQPKPGMVAARPGWRQVAAVKAQRIYTIDASIVSRPGPRIAQAIERIETDLYSPADRRR